MSQQLVITALGADRPGIVNELSDTLISHKLNIEDSRMSILGGEFAILLLVSGNEQSITSFIDDLKQIESALKMDLTTKKTAPLSKSPSTLPYNVEVIAIDNPGIVQNLAGFFSSRQINIIDLETESYPAPHTGTLMFSLHMTLNIPADIAIAELRNDFIDACDELNLDATLAPAA